MDRNLLCTRQHSTENASGFRSRHSHTNLLFRMHYCLKGPQGQVVGFRLGAEALGHEIYDILDWADEHFSSYFVKQTDDHVYVCDDAVEDQDTLHAEPLSGGDDESGPPPSGSGGGSRGGDPDDGGGGAIAETAAS